MLADREPALLADREPAWLADVRLRVLRRVAWLRECWSHGGYGDESAMAISHSEVDRTLTPGAALAAEEQAFYRRDPTARRLSAALDSLAARSADGPWPHLVTCLELTAPEANLLALALAAEAIPALRRVYGYLQDETGGSDATPGLAACLWSWPDGTGLGPAAALRRWNLARPAHQGSWPGSVQCEWQADPAVLRYLLRDPAAGPDLGGDDARLIKPPAGALVLAAAQLSELVAFLAAMQDGAVEVEITGPAGAGRTVLAAQAAAAAGRPARRGCRGPWPAARRPGRGDRTGPVGLAQRRRGGLAGRGRAGRGGAGRGQRAAPGGVPDHRHAAAARPRTRGPLRSRCRRWTAHHGCGCGRRSAVPARRRNPVADWPLRPARWPPRRRAAPAGAPPPGR